MSDDGSPQDSSNNQFEVTKNQRGAVFALNKIGQAFIDYAVTQQRPVIDMGAGFGVATIPALQ